MACEVDTTNSGCLTFALGGMSTIIWMSTGGQVSESSRDPRGEPRLEPIHNPTGSSTIPIPEEFCKRFTSTSRLGEYYITMVSKRLNQLDSSCVNLNESSPIPSVKGMDPLEASSEALRLHPEVGTNQVGEIDKVSNSSS